MSGVVRAIGWIVSLALIILSLYSIISSGEVGNQSWIFLLMIPFSVALALSSKEEKLTQTISLKNGTKMKSQRLRRIFKQEILA